METQLFLCLIATLVFFLASTKQLWNSMDRLTKIMDRFHEQDKLLNERMNIQSNRISNLEDRLNTRNKSADTDYY